VACLWRSYESKLNSVRRRGRADNSQSIGTSGAAAEICNDMRERPRRNAHRALPDGRPGGIKNSHLSTPITSPKIALEFSRQFREQLFRTVVGASVQLAQSNLTSFRRK
jgi:hypothetical protein